MGLSSLIKIEEMQDLVLNKGLSYSDISNQLMKRFPNKSGLSERSVRRFCTSNGIRKRSNYCKEEMKRIVFLESTQVGENYGRKMMTGTLRSRGVKIGERQVGQILREINVPAHNRRKVNAGRALNPRVYVADYFGHKIHYDQNEKLGMYGVVHVCARDGFSGLIVGSTTMPIKNCIIIYDQIYRPALEQFGMWDQLRIDGGKEFALIGKMQEFYRDYRYDITRTPVRATKSTLNNIIERIWVEVNNRVNYPIKSVLNDLVAKEKIDMSDETTKFCVSWVTCNVANYGLRRFVSSWNHHSIPKKGIPERLANQNKKTGNIPATMIMSKEQATQYYERCTGNSLTEPYTFGIDPLRGDTELRETRLREYYNAVISDATVFTKLISGDRVYYENAICMFQNLTITLSRQLR